jgi:mannose-1-phosphate guanylyltransferase
MRAVVLVGGFGTRLRPLTNSIPKPMLPVGNRPMIARLVDRLARGGVTEVVLALGFRPEPFVAAFPEGRCGDVTLTYAVEPEPLDTGGAIRFAAEFAGIDDTFVVANGDVMTDLDVSALVDVHRRRDAEATIHLIAVDDPGDFGVVELTAEDRIVDFVEKPAPGTEPSNLINAGTYVFEPSVLERIPGGERVSIERATFPMISAAGAMYGVATNDYWIDAGVPESYRAANLDLLGNHRNESCDPISPSALVSSNATIVNTIVGDHVVVADGATVTDSVLLPDSRVDRNSIVSASLVMGTVGRDAHVSDSMIGAEGVVSEGGELRGGMLPDPASS